MYSSTIALALAFWFLTLALLVDAGIYVVKPLQSSTCHGGQKCTIEWLDDGTRPLLPAIGVCTIGLFTGKQQLVQAIPPVDVSKVHSVTFTPNPNAGPDSEAYYISIISTELDQNSSTPYAAFSPFFRIDQMLGSFETPLPEATSTIPIPSSLSKSPLSTLSHTSTITVGTLSTSPSPSPSPSSSITSTKRPTVDATQSSSSSPSRLTTSIRPSLVSTTAPPPPSVTGSAANTGSTAPTTSLSNGTPSYKVNLGISLLTTLVASSFALPLLSIL